MMPGGDDVLVVRAVHHAEDPPRRASSWMRQGSRGRDRPCRRLEVHDRAALWVETGEHAADRAVLARGVHALQHEHARRAAPRPTGGRAASSSTSSSRSTFSLPSSFAPRPRRSAGLRWSRQSAVPGRDDECSAGSTASDWPSADDASGRRTAKPRNASHGWRTTSTPGWHRSVTHRFTTVTPSSSAVVMNRQITGADQATDDREHDEHPELLQRPQSSNPRRARWRSSAQGSPTCCRSGS